MNKEKLKNNIDNALLLVTINIVKADKKMDKIEEKITIENLHLLFKDILDRNDEDLNSRVYRSL